MERTKKVEVEINKQLYDMMRILEKIGIKTIEEFLREGLAEKVDKEFEMYLELRRIHAEDLKSQ